MGGRHSPRAGHWPKRTLPAACGVARGYYKDASLLEHGIQPVEPARKKTMYEARPLLHKAVFLIGVLAFLAVGFAPAQTQGPIGKQPRRPLPDRTRPPEVYPGQVRSKGQYSPSHPSKAAPRGGL